LAELSWIPRVVEAECPAASGLEPLRQRGLGERLNFWQDPICRLGRDELSELLVIKAEQLRRIRCALLLDREALDIWSEHLHEPGTAQALQAGVGIRHRCSF
jgi:hypothetical protein